MLAMLDSLLKFDENKVALDEMIALSAFAKALRSEYETRNITVPEAIDAKLRDLNKAIVNNQRDTLELRLKEINQEKTRLMTPAERREALAAEEAKLKAQLATA